MHINGKGKSYSDSERFYPWKTGYDIFKKHKLFGIGVENLKPKASRDTKHYFRIKF